MKILKVLIACEESQRVCTEFRKLGHEAYSADIQEPSGGHPEWHILGDVLNILQGGDSALWTAQSTALRSGIALLHFLRVHISQWLQLGIIAYDSRRLIKSIGERWTV